MAEKRTFNQQLQELVDRKWDISAIELRCRALMDKGIPAKSLDREWILANREEILDRVQRRAEEYNFFAGNCARSSAMAVMEEFGLGNMEVIKSLTPLPGFGGTGWMCGGVTGGLVALGLHFGSTDLQNREATAAAMQAGRLFMNRFEAELGAVTCRKIQEDVVFGRFMDPGASPENMAAFAQARGFEKCSMLPGIGARLAAGVIIESMASHG
jgi:C_GCAxxG_C_C family probable redox protein